MARRRVGTTRHRLVARIHGWLGRATVQASSWLGTVRSALIDHPRWSVAAIALIALGLVLNLVDFSPQDQGAMVSERVLVLPEPGERIAEQAVQPATAAPAAVVDHADSKTIESARPAGRDWQLVEVRSGQTLERIFRNLGLSARDLHEVVSLDQYTRRLARIRPGDQFGFDIDDDGQFVALRADYDEDRWLIVQRGEDGLESRMQPRAMDSRIVEASGIISSSLFNAASKAGLSDNMTMRLANIFGWDIDFALDIRSGDRFALIYEEIWRDGEFLRDGPILAARFVNRGDSFEAIRFDAGNGPDYFAPDGRPMRKAFLRAPLNFTRVTSNFNPRRFHPITRQVRPHNGTDYGAPTGTPVWAAGDGRVIRSAYNNANGNYVFIQHGNHIVTRYLHLHRRSVRVGDRVRQGQTIGTVGMTGMATGPHLHYEFLVNGAHRNPRTVDLPDADPLPADQMEAFRQAQRPLLAQLDALQGPTVLLAQRDELRCEGADTDC